MNAIRSPDGRADIAGSLPCAEAGPKAHSVESRIAAQSVAIRTRGRQRVGVSNDAAEYAYVVRGGVFTITATMPGDRHQILGLLYPGDVIRGSQLPPLQGAAMIAMTATGEVARVKWRQLETLAADDAEIARHLYDRLADQAARQAMHAAVIGSLTGEERVASLLLELANRIGAPVADGLAFDILLSRADIADYLALNADTVSRIISRLRAKGLVSQSGRSRFICHDSEALAQESPVAQALTELCRRDERPPGT